KTKQRRSLAWLLLMEENWVLLSYSRSKVTPAACCLIPVSTARTALQGNKGSCCQNKQNYVGNGWRERIGSPALVAGAGPCRRDSGCRECSVGFCRDHHAGAGLGGGGSAGAGDGFARGSLCHDHGQRAGEQRQNHQQSGKIHCVGGMQMRCGAGSSGK